MGGFVHKEGKAVEHLCIGFIKCVIHFAFTFTFELRDIAGEMSHVTKPLCSYIVLCCWCPLLAET